MSITVNHHAALAREHTIRWSFAAPESMSTKLGTLAVAAFLHITGLPDSRQSLVTR